MGVIGSKDTRDRLIAARNGAPRPKIQYKRRPNALKFTPEKKELALAVYAVTGRKSSAAAAAGISLTTFEAHRTETHAQYDEEFADNFDEAHLYYVEEILEAEVDRRAVHGVKEPIIGGKDRDKIIGYITKYSDRLLLAKLKAKGGANWQDKVEVTKKKEGGSKDKTPAVDITKLNRPQREAYRAFLRTLEPTQIDGVVEGEIVEGELLPPPDPAPAAPDPDPGDGIPTTDDGTFDL